MSVISHELQGSRAGTDGTSNESSAELIYIVRGSDDTTVIRQHMLSVLPSTYDDLKFKSITWKQDGPLIWTVTANYVQFVPELGSYVFNFDTSGETVHMDVAYAVFDSASTGGGTAPNLLGAINLVNGPDGHIQGVDGITAPGLRFSIEKMVPQANLTMTYVRTLAGLTGSMNNAEYLGFAAGELLFIGAQGSQSINEGGQLTSNPIVTYNFIAAPNVTLTIAGQAIDKRGHDYISVVNNTREVTTGDGEKHIVQLPKWIYSLQVYPLANFSLLAI